MADEPTISGAAPSVPSGDMVPQDVVDKYLAAGNDGPITTTLADLAARGVETEDEDTEGDEAAARPEKAAPDKPEAEKPDAEKEPEAERDELKEVLKDIRKVLAERAADPPKPEPDKAPEVDPYIQSLLESEDPQEQKLGARLLAQEQRIQASEERAAQAEQRALEVELDRAAEVYAKNIEDVSAQCVPPLTEEEKDAVTDLLTDKTDGPALAESLTFRQGVLLRYPGRIRETNGKAHAGTTKVAPEGAKPPANGAAPRPGGATIMDRGGTAGPSPAKPQAPDPKEDMEQTVARGMRALGLTR